MRKLLARRPLVRKLYFSVLPSLRFMKERLRPATSYSQFGEDLIVARLLGEVRFFVDIGANDGISFSNTFLFYLRGARGVCFEPVAETFLRLSSLYRFSTRVACVKCGISDTRATAEIVAADGLSFIPATEDPRHSEFHPALASVSRTETIELRTFEDATAGLDMPSTIDLLNIDVEGHELSVLRSLPFHRYDFRCLILETHLLDEQGAVQWRHRDLDDMEALLKENGFAPVETTIANTIYLRRVG